MSTTYPDLDSYFPFADGSTPFRPAKPLAKHEAEQLPRKETREAQRRERVERLLSGELRKHVRPASELAFNYDRATELATLQGRKRSREPL